MGKLLRLHMILNKKNGQININLPKKKLDSAMRKKLTKSRFARMWLEDFE